MANWEVVTDERVASQVIGGVGPIEEPKGVIAGCDS